MGRNKTKPFTRTEIKILIYNKVRRGLSYEQAKAEVERDIHAILDNHKMSKKEKEKFDEEFKRLCKKKI